MVTVCCCSLAGTAACHTCRNNPASDFVRTYYPHIPNAYKPKTYWLERRFSEKTLGYECPVCHTTWDYRTNYCPNCGTRLEREE